MLAKKCTCEPKIIPTHRQVIETKFIGATNYKPSRIKATTSGSGVSVTLSIDHSLDSDEMHAIAASTLIHKLGWDDRTSKLAQGCTKNGYVFVYVYEGGKYLV